MTNNEAVSRIKFLLNVGGSDGFTNADEEALNMAINALSAEIIKPPKSNGDKIRQMTDEELADFITSIPNQCGAIPCLECNFNLYDKGCAAYSKKAADIWLKQEAREDAGTDD